MALAGIQKLSTDIQSDMQSDPSVRKATRAWSACMAGDGYNITDPRTAFLRAINAGGAQVVFAKNGKATAKSQASIALAVTDADCAQSTDLAGIYFAVQASYEQQLVDRNQQALTAAVDEYRAAYEKELGKISGQLPTAPTTGPFPGRLGKVARLSTGKG